MTTQQPTKKQRSKWEQIARASLICINPGTLLFAGLVGGIVVFMGVVVFIILPQIPALG